VLGVGLHIPQVAVRGGALPAWVLAHIASLGVGIDPATVLSVYQYDTGRFWHRNTGSNIFERFHTVTRASGAWAENLAGDLESYGSGIARRNSKGIWVFDQAVEKVRNSAFVGGGVGVVPPYMAAATSGVLTPQITGVGTEYGRAYIDVTVAGTASGIETPSFRFEGTQQIAALTGQTWGARVGCRIVGGSMAGFTSFQLVMWERTSAGVFVAAQSQAVTPTATYQVIKKVATLSGGATTAFVQPVVQWATQSGATVHLTLRFYVPNCRQASHIASEVVTTGSEVTVNADRIDFASDALPLLAAQGAQLIEYYTPPTMSGVINKYVTDFDAGNINDRIRSFLVGSNNQPQVLVRTGGVDQALLASGSTYPAEGAPSRLALSHQADAVKIKAPNNALVSDTSATMPASFARAALGHPLAADSQFNGCIKSLATFSAPLTDAQMNVMAP
jgi:hypothetical protein